MTQDRAAIARNLSRRRRFGIFFEWVCAGAAMASVAILGFLLTDIVRDGASSITQSFFTSFPSRFPEQAGIKAALFGSVWLMGLTAIMAIPLGLGAAIYLEEYSRKNWILRFIQLNVSNLAGVPSVVYGILGLAIFVRAFNFGWSLLSGAMTMSLLILPVLIVSSQEALRAVPDSIRRAAYAVGASKWQTLRDHVLPSAMPGVLTGIILSLSRAIGESAPLIMIGAMAFIAFTPSGPLDSFTVLPIQIYNWASRPQAGFHAKAAGAIIVLLFVLLTMNAIAIFVRERYQRKIKW